MAAQGASAQERYVQLQAQHAAACAAYEQARSPCPFRLVAVPQALQC
jgi:hypothetical protein